MEGKEVKLGLIAKEIEAVFSKIQYGEIFKLKGINFMGDKTLEWRVEVNCLVASYEICSYTFIEKLESHKDIIKDLIKGLNGNIKDLNKISLKREKKLEDYLGGKA